MSDELTELTLQALDSDLKQMQLVEKLVVTTCQEWRAPPEVVLHARLNYPAHTHDVTRPIGDQLIEWFENSEDIPMQAWLRENERCAW